MLSGLFSNTEQDFFLPEDISQRAFEDYVRSHVSINKAVSPFISTFQSPLAPVHRSLRAGEGARVSIIDPSRLGNHVYSARMLVKDLGIRISGYRGIGEHLVWGRIETRAIICSFTITSLVRIAEEDREIGQILQLDVIGSSPRNRGNLHQRLSLGPGKLDWSSGRVVGRMLRKLSVPDLYIERIALGISRSWRFSRSGRQDEYLKGVREGYLSPSSAATVSPQAPLQNEPYTPVEEDSDVDMNDEDIEDEDEDDDRILPSFESPPPPPPPRHHPTVALAGALCPRVEFFDPMKQQWTEAPAATDRQHAPPLPYQQKRILTTSANPIEIDSEKSSTIMGDEDLEVFMEEFVNFD